MLLTIFAIEVSPQFNLILTTKGKTRQNASGQEASCPRVPSGLSVNWMNEELKRFNILEWSTITSDAPAKFDECGLILPVVHLQADAVSLFDDCPDSAVDDTAGVQCDGYGVTHLELVLII